MLDEMAVRKCLEYDKGLQSFSCGVSKEVAKSHCAEKDDLRVHGSNKKNLLFCLWASDKPTPVP